MDLHKRAAAHGQTRAAGLCLAALDWHQDRGQTPREQCPRPGTPREDQPLGSAQNHYAHGAVPSMAVGMGAAVSSPRKGISKKWFLTPTRVQPIRRASPSGFLAEGNICTLTPEGPT